VIFEEKPVAAVLSNIDHFNLPCTVVL